jgi:hypothetical protein
MQAAEVLQLPTTFPTSTSRRHNIKNLVLFDSCNNVEDQARQSQQDHGSEEGQGHEGSWQEIRSA